MSSSLSKSLLSKSFVSKYGPVLLIIGGLLAWGGFHALGAYLSLAQRPGWASPAISVVAGGQGQSAEDAAKGRDPRKALVVGVCTAGFIGFWLLALVGAGWRRRRAARRLAEQGEQEAGAEAAGAENAQENLGGTASATEPAGAAGARDP